MKNCVFGIMFCAACSMIGETCATNKTVSLLGRGLDAEPEGSATFTQDLRAKVQAVLTIEGMDPTEIVFFDADGSYTAPHKRTATYTVRALNGADRTLTVKLSNVGLMRIKDESNAAIRNGDAFETSFCWYLNDTSLGEGEEDTPIAVNNVNNGDLIKVIFDIPQDFRKEMKGGQYEGTATFEVVSVS